MSLFSGGFLSNLFARISAGDDNMATFFPVPVTTEWIDAATAAADIAAATGWTWPSGEGSTSKRITVTLWEGASDPDDFAVLIVGNGYASWHDFSIFTSMPASGTVYIIGVVFEVFISPE